MWLYAIREIKRIDVKCARQAFRAVDHYGFMCKRYIKVEEMEQVVWLEVVE